MKSIVPNRRLQAKIISRQKRLQYPNSKSLHDPIPHPEISSYYYRSGGGGKHIGSVDICEILGVCQTQLFVQINGKSSMFS